MKKPTEIKRDATNQAIHVVLSCETMEQLHTARKYCNLVVRRHMLDSFLFAKLVGVLERKCLKLRP